MTKGVISSDQALPGFKAAMDAALGRGSQALTKWIEDVQQNRRRRLLPPSGVAPFWELDSASCFVGSQ